MFEKIVSHMCNIKLLYIEYITNNVYRISRRQFVKIIMECENTCEFFLIRSS